MLKQFFAVAFIAIALSATGKALAADGVVPMPVSFDQVQGASRLPPSYVHRYGASPSQLVWAWSPPDGAKPVAATVVLLHGGCWLNAYSVDHIAPLATALARNGFTVWAPEYRRVGDEGGGWPGTFADVQDALEELALRSNALSPAKRVVLVGHSAGGHLALWLAARPAALQPNHLDMVGVIGLAAITDLVSYGSGSNSCQQVTQKLLGGTSQELLSRYEAASPSSYQTVVPTILLRGSEDPIVGADQIEAMAGVRSLELEGAGHFDWIHPDTAAFTVLLRSVDDLLSASAADAKP